ncbi:MAG: SagB/ThcOx family dehydrogenase [Desulfobulbaceae bacterium]|nr:SagB/ThcOx family dehydrogenase [Desulfobulbaceae bacterium]
MNIQLFSKSIKLPKPQYDSNVSIEETLLKRRSIRSYKSEPLAIAEISQLLWSAQGVTNRKGFRTAPSAGALYPLEVYIAAGNVTDLDAGIYKYYPHRHEIVNTVKGNKRSELCRAGLGQSSIKNAPAVMVFCAVFERVTRSYGKRGIQYVHMEVGHAIQNVCLQAISLGLGSVIIGAFNDYDVKEVMNFELDEHPLLILPVGKLKNV